jgi:uncharacterized membrane protein YhiD involved in acid resistance
MFDQLARAVGAPETAPLQTLVRLVLAMVLGGVVALVYRSTRAADEVAPSFTITLVLLSILIAMVTQVIGDNVARAFSLVGALSIVRFRTVVRDTQDTAYVIFSVAVGMAVGAGHPVLALSGIGVVALAAFLMRPGAVALPARHETYLLTVRLGLGHDSATVLGPTFDTHTASRHLVSVSTTKQGMSLELLYRAALRSDEAAEDLVRALNRLDGVQGIALQRMDARED